MASDSDWVQDVRRWYFGGSPPASEQTSTADTTGDAGADVMVGYEAAHPSLPLARASPRSHSALGWNGFGGICPGGCARQPPWVLRGWLRSADASWRFVWS